MGVPKAYRMSAAMPPSPNCKLRPLANGSSSNASKGSGCGGVRTVSTISCTSGLPGSTDAGRPCSTWHCPRTRNYARSILFIHEHDFGGRFCLEQLYELFNFCDERRNPHFEFIDTTLEHARKDLLEKIEQFSDLIAHNTCPIDTSGYNDVPWEWRSTQPERYKQVIEQLNQLASQIWECYSSLVKMGRTKLGVQGI